MTDNKHMKKNLTLFLLMALVVQCAAQKPSTPSPKMNEAMGSLNRPKASKVTTGVYDEAFDLILDGGLGPYSIHKEDSVVIYYAANNEKFSTTRSIMVRKNKFSFQLSKTKYAGLISGSLAFAYDTTHSMTYYSGAIARIHLGNLYSYASFNQLKSLHFTSELRFEGAGMGNVSGGDRHPLSGRYDAVIADTTLSFSIETIGRDWSCDWSTSKNNLRYRLYGKLEQVVTDSTSGKLILSANYRHYIDFGFQEISTETITLSYVMKKGESPTIMTMSGIKLDRVQP